jgi:hypothetical protein
MEGKIPKFVTADGQAVTTPAMGQRGSAGGGRGSSPRKQVTRKHREERSWKRWSRKLMTLERHFLNCLVYHMDS